MSSPTAYGSHQVKLVYVIDINMKLNTVFTMVVDLKTGCEGRTLQNMY